MFHTTHNEQLIGNPIDDVIGSSIKYAAIVTAAHIGLFRALESGPMTSEELASSLSASEQGISILADTLVPLGYLEQQDGRYASGPVARRWLNPKERLDFTPALLWGYELWKVLWDLPQAIRDGKPAQSLWERWADNPKAGADFSDYMKVKSTLTLPAIVEHLPLPAQAKRLLDLGGSHGLHSMGLCRRYPALEAVIMDLPEALANTGEALKEAELSDRIRLQPGSFLKDEFGTGFDVVLLFEILHNHTPEENRTLLERAHRCLRPGGRVVVLEDVRGKGIDEHNAAFSLAMFACSGDRTYSKPEIEDWMTSAGFKRVQEIPLPSSVSLVVADVD